MRFLSISKHKQCEWDYECYRTAVKIMFIQMSTKQGIKQFKERAIDEIVKEYKQLHYMNTFGRVCPEHLIPKHKRDALHAITLIKGKRSGEIKGI